MYPNVEQYTVSFKKIEYKDAHIGFLSCAFTSSAASPKGLARQTATGVVCRNCNETLLKSLVELYDIVDGLECQCYEITNEDFNDEESDNEHRIKLDGVRYVQIGVM